MTEEELFEEEREDPYQEYDGILRVIILAAQGALELGTSCSDEARRGLAKKIIQWATQYGWGEYGDD